jgi:hypothetical protein
MTDSPASTLDRNGRIGSIAVAAAAIFGIALRVRQYAANGSLWIDELALAHNLDERSLRSLLTEPLDRNQVAPRGFLLVEKLVNGVSHSDLALRAFAFACSAAALVLFWRLAARLLFAPAAFVAVALLATARPVIYYGIQLKQYSCDLLASVILIDLGIRLQDRDASRRLRVAAAIAGAVLVWFAQASVLILAAIGLVLTVRSLRDGTWRRLLPVVTIWALAAAAATIAGLESMTPQTRAYMHEFWADGFMPLPLRAAVKAFWPWQPLAGLFARSLLYVWPAVFVAIAVAGLVVLCCRFRWGIVAVAPILMTAAAAAAQQYPFRERLILFLLPNIFLGVGALLAWITAHWRRARLPAAWLLAAAVLVPATLTAISKPPPYLTENTKALLVALKPRLQPRDRLYVYYGASSSMAYYGARYGLNEGRYVVGDCHRADTRSYYRELDAFRGAPRVWIVIVHAIATYRERDDILAYVSALGTRRDQVIIPSTLTPYPFGAAEAYLYDFSDAERAKAVDAATFPVRGPHHLLPGAGCSGSQQPVLRRRVA